MSNINWGQEIKDWVISILIAVVLALFIRYFIVELYLVEGPSMRPTLTHSERLVVNKFIYFFRTPQRGEILVFRYPRDPRRDFIKRVIGIPGDIIEVRQGQVFRNGELLLEPYILEMTRGSFPATKVPEGHVFAMGDNRNNSEDSRSKAVGFVPLEMVKGKAVLVFWPPSQFKALP